MTTFSKSWLYLLLLLRAEPADMGRGLLDRDLERDLAEPGLCDLAEPGRDLEDRRDDPADAGLRGGGPMLIFKSTLQGCPRNVAPFLFSLLSFVS